ncbi:MAG TPA: hypothetical protein VJ487_02105 [Alphaproteobacteria bacterium]|nr:hypothetical protein [Alphaproteobacteria bacterium]
MTAFSERECAPPRGKCSRVAGAAALAAALALSACGQPTSGVWSKEGATQEALRRDQRACVAEAGNYGFLVPPTSQGGGSTAATRQQGDIYRACMAQKGYNEYAPGSVPQMKPQESQ